MSNTCWTAHFQALECFAWQHFSVLTLFGYPFWPENPGMRIKQSQTLQTFCKKPSTHIHQESLWQWQQFQAANFWTRRSQKLCSSKLEGGSPLMTFSNPGTIQLPEMLGTSWSNVLALHNQDQQLRPPRKWTQKTVVHMLPEVLSPGLHGSQEYFPSLSWLQIVHLYCQDTDWFINSLPRNQTQEQKWKYRFRLNDCTYISQTKSGPSIYFLQIGTLSLKIDQLTTSKRNGGIAVKAGRSGDIGVRVGTAEERVAIVSDARHEVNKLHNS